MSTDAIRVFQAGYQEKTPLEQMLMAFFPGRRFCFGGPFEGEGVRCEVRMEGHEDRALVSIALSGQRTEGRASRPAPSDKGETGDLIKRAAFEAAAAQTGLRPEWGILTGVRPVKLATALLRGGMSPAEAAGELRRRFLVREEKAALAALVALTEEPLLGRVREDSFSLYIGIPFCPSRCAYCSFVSQAVGHMPKMVEPYLELLERELAAVSGISRGLGLSLQSVYIGGGTPTSLTAPQLDRVMGAVERGFDLSAAEEYTVEAGRPDTVTREKLRVIRERGAKRISINPQSMNEDTLRAIGRRHSPGEVLSAFSLAREEGFACINMDVIAGLADEGPADFARTVDCVAGLRPENVTVHTLSLKKGARIKRARVFPR